MQVQPTILSPFNPQLPRNAPSAVRPASPAVKAPAPGPDPTAASVLGAGSPPPPSPTTPEPLSVQDLLEAWGGNDPRYDLNADGTVDMGDLVQLLGALSRRQPPVIPPEEAPDVRTAGRPPSRTGDPEGIRVAGNDTTITSGGDSTNRTDTTQGVALADDGKSGTTVGDPGNTGSTSGTDPAKAVSLADGHDHGTTVGDPGDDEPVTVAGLLEAWGTDNARFDLNGDGTVDMGDLVNLLGSMSQRDVPPGDVAGTGTNLDGPRPITISGLLEAWGETGSRFDLDSDGVVNMGDLVRLLSILGTRDGGDPEPTSAAATGTAATGPRAIASSLFDILQGQGFGQRPPGNLHQLVDLLKLDPAEARQVRGQLRSRYPAGLGVNLVG